MLLGSDKLLTIEFQNRKSELQTLKAIASHTNERARIDFLRAPSAAGLTSFLKHAKTKLAGENCLTVFCNIQSTGTTSIFQSFFGALDEQMDVLSRKLKRPEAFRKFVRDTVGGGLAFLIPGGGMLKPATEGLFDRIRLSYHSSTVAERFTTVVEQHLSSKAIVFLIDNAQNLYLDELEIFQTTIGKVFSNVSFVVGYVDREKKNIQFEDLVDRISSLGKTPSIQRFEPPDHLLVEDILHSLKVTIDSTVSQEIARRSGSNAHKLISEIRAVCSGNNLEYLQIGGNQKILLTFLLAAEQALPLNFLDAVFKASPMVFLDAGDELSAYLKPLLDDGLAELIRINGHPVAIGISATSIPVLQELSSDKIAMLSASNSLYRAAARFVSEYESSDGYLLPLRYELAKKVDPARTAQFALALVEHAIRNGSLSTAERFSQALPPPERAADIGAYLIGIALLIARKAYQEALEKLGSAPEPSWMTDVRVAVLKAICLDRVRAHHAALATIDELLPKCLDPEIEAILGAIKVASLQHLGKLELAIDTFNSLEIEVSHTRNFAFLLRNAASLYGASDALGVLRKAEEIFEKQEDRYGKSTCLANLGSVFANDGQLKEAGELFDIAQKGLSPFGFVHMEEALCNLALVELLQGRVDRAANRLDDIICYGQENMPKLYALDHLSLLKIITGNYEEALKALDLADKLMRQVEVPIAKVRHELNAAMLRHAAGANTPSIDFVLRNLGTIQGEPKKIANQIALKLRLVWDEISPQNAAEYYSPGYLEYWSINALYLLPASFLPSATVR